VRYTITIEDLPEGGGARVTSDPSCIELVKAFGSMPPDDLRGLTAAQSYSIAAWLALLKLAADAAAMEDEAPPTACGLH
jgi:hypothetical protein